MSSLLASGQVRMVAGFVPTHADLYRLLLATTVWDDRIRARKSASFGTPYNYSGIDYPTIAFPVHLLPTADQLEQKLGYRSNNCLANFYPDGVSTMGFHSDSTTQLEPGTGIAIISLGAERTLTFRHQEDRTRLESFRLPSGSLLFMSAVMQNEWKHAILPEEGAGPRISLTFRRLLL